MRFLLSVFLLLTTLFADNTITATTENDPSSLVDGVSVITGDLYVFEEDYIIQGAQPISIRRSYVSREGVSRDYDYLICSFREGTNHFCILEPNGTALFYLPSIENKIAPIAGKSFYGKPEKKKKWKPLVYETKHFVSKAPGVSNTSSGKVSAHTNLKNQRIVFDPNIDSKGKSFTLYASNGTKRRYVALSHQEKGDFHYGRGYLEYFYRLVSEELPHGHVIHYSWDDDNHLKEIYSTPKGHFGKKFASAKVPSSNAKKPSAQSVLTGSDGRSLTCHRQPTSKKRVWLPHLITSPENPDISFHWVYSNKLRRHRIEQFILPQGRVLQVTYDDTSESRVKTLSSPVGKGNAFVVTHTFAYDPKRRHSSVVDAKGNKTAYSWNDQYRLTRIDQYEGSSTLRSSEHFVWEGSELKCKTHIDETGQALFSKTFLYDTGGNVKEERFYGNLSGKGTPLQLDGNGLPVENGVESAIRKVSYTSDGTNLPLREEEPNGLVVAYTYLPGTHLPTSKLLLEGDQIKVRTLYGYDGDFILRREIVDDGSSQDPNNLSDVTVRTIKEITPRQSNPYIGLPETVEEKYWDGAKELLLKKEIFYYTTGALVEKKEVFDGDGRFRYALTYSYDPKGRLEEETNPIGQRAMYRYDDLGNRIYAKDFSGRVERKFKYDHSNRMSEKEEIGFDGIHRVFGYSYDAKHNLESETDPQGNQILYEHDPFGRQIKETLPPAPKTSAVTEQKYDSAHNVKLRIDARKNATATIYNAYGKPILITHPDGTTELFTYFLDGSLQVHTDPKGIQTEYSYDFLGRVLTKTISSSLGEERASETLKYRGLHLISKIDAEGYETRFAYDGAGRKIREERCSEKKLYSFDPCGRVHRIQEGEMVTVAEYDEMDRPIFEKKESLSGEIVRSIAYGYDVAGNRALVIRSVAGKEATETFVYDSMNRLIQKNDPLGHSETITYDEAFQNEWGQTVVQKIDTDPLSLQTIETYDSMGRIASTEKKKGITLSLQEKSYNLNGFPIYQTDTVISPDGTSRRVHTSWEYDSRDRVKELIEAEGTHDQKTTTYTYHPRGEIFQISKPDGTLLTHDYNDLGHLISLVSSDGTVEHLLKRNKLGHLTTLDGIQRTVDHKGRLLTEVYPQGFSIEHRYDTRGRKEALFCPKADCFISYGYETLDLKTVHWQNFTHSYTTYDLSGNILEEEMIFSLGTLRYTRDPLSRKRALSAPGLFQEILEYDKVGNIRKMRIFGEELTYEYDDLYQLTSESGPLAHTYSCDSLYNRLQKDSETYEINALNQLTRFEYDSNGNPIRYDDMTLAYDALGRLIRLETPTTLQTLTYDYLNRCLSKTTDGETLYFLYDGQNEIGSFDRDLTIQELRILGASPHAEIGAAIAIQLGQQIYAPLHDIQGNVAALTPLSGASTTYRYSAFGEEKTEGAAPNPWRFRSKRTDSLTHLVNFGRRYYIPALGRWLTPDPIGFADGMNLYAYVHNDPLTHFDEYGLIDYGQWSWDKKSTPSVSDRYFSAMVHAAYQPVGSFLEASIQSFRQIGFPGSNWSPMDGHKGIDRLLGTNLAHHFDPSSIYNQFQSSFATLEMPWPGTMTAMKTSQIGLKTFRNISTLQLLPRLNSPVGGAYNRAAFEEYKAVLRAQMKKPYVVNARLKDYVDLNYKPHASIGSGSTAAAIRHELATGGRVFDKLHSQKGKDMIIALEKWLKNNPIARPGDRAAAENIIKDLHHALGE